MLKRPELSKKEVKILEYRLKTCLSARPNSRKPKKGVQNALEHESVFGVQKYHSTLLECRSALSKCWMALFWALAQFSSSANKTHHFRLFHKKTCPDLHSTRCCLFFKYSRNWISKFSTFLLRSRRDTFSHSQISHPLSGILS